MNVMRDIKIEKVTLNIGVGGPGDKLEKAVKLLKSITNSQPIQTKVGPRTRIPAWGLRPNLPIATKVTVRGKKAEALLRRLLQSVDNHLGERKFDKFGNFAFGIPEYINIPDTPYDAEIGVIGLEAAVTLMRSGFRIKRRATKKGKIPVKHSISKEDAMKFIKDKFSVKVGDEE